MKNNKWDNIIIPNHQPEEITWINRTFDQIPYGSKVWMANEFRMVKGKTHSETTISHRRLLILEHELAEFRARRRPQDVYCNTQELFIIWDPEQGE